jgi:signal transduction histidine kinase
MEGERIARRELLSIVGGGAPTVWMSINAQPVRGEDGRIEAGVLVIRDVSAEKHAQAQQMFADRMASIGVLAAGVAHEINNPLGTVVAELDMALEDTAGQAVHQGLVLAREAADRVKLIVRDLKTLSRGETDDLSAIDVVAALESALRMAGAHTRTRAVVERQLIPVPRVIGNAARVGQVFLNLLLNAADALPDRDPGLNRIVVRTRSDEGNVIAEVTDNGSGMPVSVRERLFTPFFTTKPVGRGSGLGLSVSHGIVANMGGSIEVESEVGIGTTFRLRFPAHRGAL